MILFKNSFKSNIGKIFYIFTADRKNSPEIVFLSNNEGSFKSYSNKLKGKFPKASFIQERSGVIEYSVLSYLEGKSPAFNISRRFLTGTEFEKKVWQATEKIPYGSVSSYKDIAGVAGNPAACRAAGTALGNNPIMLIIPCHRVIKSSGSIGRYGGGDRVKEFLLKMEAALPIG